MLSEGVRQVGTARVSGKQPPMASNNSSVVQSFSIALIVFVMLTFVLAVTTYLFFKEWDVAQQKVKDANAERNAENEVKLAYRDSRAELVRDVLGFPEDDPEVLKSKAAVEKLNEQIKLKKQDAIDDVYGNYLKPPAYEKPTYESAVDWLSSSIEKHNEAMSSLQGEKDRFAAEKKVLAEKHDAEMKKLVESRKDAQDKLDDLQKQKTAYEKESTDQKNKLVSEKSAAEDQAKRFKLLGEEIAKGKPYLSPERAKNWPADAAAGGGDKGAAEAGSNERRVALMLEEMRDRERTIVRLNQIVAQLRAADPALQATVLAATPKDDRVDEFDGRILSVNELDRTVLVSVGRTTGLRTGLKFYVYNPTDPQPQIGSKKAVVEVVAIESDSLVRCRVRQDSVRDPIIPGDVVATSLWSPGTPLEVVIVGITQFGADPESDRKRLDMLVERIGGTVAESVTPATTMVVDAGVPQVKGVDAEGQVASRKFWNTKQKENRVRQMDAAKQLGIKVMAIEPFLDMLGLQVESVRANRLPVPIDSNAAPARTENVAF